ncbi:MAG TPA: DUF5723 family protein [Gemmatimonadaceae bacterium]|nr:DUF5723 family protein [Gemmatimonadaceae bacterium]
MKRNLLRGAAALSLLAGARGVLAQLPDPSAASVGLGNNYLARARGFAAPAWNPANLGLSGNPRLSFTILPVRGAADVGPISLSDVAQYGGAQLPDAVRDGWMARIEANGGQRGQLGGGITYVALSARRFAFQLSTAADGEVNLAPDAVEAILYGNVGRTGTSRELRMEGSKLSAAVTTTAAVSYARAIDFVQGRLSIGVTGKYIVGNALVHGQDRGSRIAAGAAGVDVRFPVVMSDSGSPFGSHGSGVALDLGAAWEAGPLSGGVVLQNMVSTFAWNTSDFVYRPIEAFYGTDSSYSSTDVTLPLDSAPADVREWVSDQRYNPTLAVGGAVHVSRKLIVSADARGQLKRGMRSADRSHVGVGAELRLIPFVPLRFGGAMIPRGHLLSVGVGLEAGPANINFGVQSRTVGNQSAPGAALAVSFGTR